MTVEEIMQTMAYGPAPEADDKALGWIERHGGAFKLFIGGQWVDAQSGERFEVSNPATGAAIATVAQAGKADVDAAVAAAAQAFASRPKLPGCVQLMAAVRASAPVVPVCCWPARCAICAAVSCSPNPINPFACVSVPRMGMWRSTCDCPP